MSYRATSADWGRQITDVLSKMTPCVRCVAYQIDADLGQTNHVAHDGQKRWVASYQQKYMQIDPLSPSAFDKQPETLVVPGWNYSMSRLTDSAYYRKWMRPLDLHFKVEMFFRDPSGNLIGGARLARGHEQGAFRQDEIALLQSVQPMMEAFAQRALASNRLPEGGLTPLTRRERQIALLVADGLSNDQIRQHTGTSLATVKSQLASTFRKLDVNRRAELAAMIHKHPMH